MDTKRSAAAPRLTDEVSSATENGQAAAGRGTAGDTDRQARIRLEMEEVAEAVIRNYQGKDPEVASSGLAQFLAEKGKGSSEFAAEVRELRVILRRRLPKHKAN